MKDHIQCTCVILNYNDSVTTLKLVDEIINYDSIDHIVIVDNCSSDNSFHELQEHADSKVMIFRTKKNGGYGYGNNYGVKKAKELYNAKYVLIANPDVHFSDVSIGAELLTLDSNENYAVIAPCQLDIQNQRIKDIAWKCPTYFQYTFVDTRLFKKWTDTNYDKAFFQDKKICKVDCVPGSLLLVNVNMFLKVGGYDEDIFLYCEESTLGLKLKRAGYETLLDLSHEYVHEHSVSINKTYSDEKKKYALLVESRLKVIRSYLAKNIFQYWIAVITYRLILLKKDIRGLLR